MEWSVRTGRAEDSAILAKLSMMAGHGFVDVLYSGLFPGRPLEDVVVERRSLNPASFGYFGNWRVAVNEADQAIGGINDFLPDDFAEFELDPIVPEDRRAIIAPFGKLDAHIENTLHINMLAVLPEFRHHGIARGLLQTAVDRSRRAGLPALSLLTFEQDDRLVRYYESLGFRIMGRCPMIPHPLFQCDGNLVAMVMPVSLGER